MSRTCCIFGAGDYGGFFPSPQQLDGALLIAADGGFAAMARHGLTPHLAVGDFDSLGRVPQGVPVLRHPPEKDDTDMVLAADEGLARGCDRFLIFGGLGGRLDHSLANLHLLARLAERGCPAFLLGDGSGVTAVRSGTLTFSPAHRGTVSLFAWGGPARGVTLSGLRYPLTEGILTPTHPLGVSNEFTSREATVSVADGTLLVLFSPLAHGELPLHH